MKKKYRYEDWWDGKIALVFSRISFNQGENVITVNWKEIVEKDIPLLKTKQKELFEEQKTNFFEKLKTIFIGNYGRSGIKDKLLREEINQCDEIFSIDIHFNNFKEEIDLKFWNHSFKWKEIVKIQGYYKNYILRGKERNFDFIHSPNFPYQDKDEKMPLEIYAQALWDYWIWLKLFDNKQPQPSSNLKQLNPEKEKEINLAIIETLEDKALSILRLKTELKKYGFFNLEMIRDLPSKTSEKLIEIINRNELPYQIAMIYYLGFVNHLERKYFNVKNNLYKCISEILKTDERGVKGNLLVLNPISKENKERYTSHTHIETVKNDYQKVK